MWPVESIYTAWNLYQGGVQAFLVSVLEDKIFPGDIEAPILPKVPLTLLLTYLPEQPFSYFSPILRSFSPSLMIDSPSIPRYDSTALRAR